MSVAQIVETALSSPWLPAILLVSVAADGPFPVLPSEPLLFAAVSRAAGADETSAVTLLVLAAFVGSLLGDAVLYGAGRSSLGLVAASERPDGTAAWARRHLQARPMAVLATLRIVPGGRLVSVSAAGRAAVPLSRVIPASIVSSVLWTAYMTTVGLVLTRLTGGDAVWSMVAGLLSGATIGALAALVGRLNALAASAAGATAAARLPRRAGCRG